MSEVKQLRIKDIGCIDSGFAFASSDFLEFGVPIIRMSDLKKGYVHTQKASRVPPSKVFGLERFQIKPGDLLLGMSGSLDAYGIAARDIEVSYINQRVGRLSIFDKETSCYGFFSRLLTSSSYHRYAYKEAVGVAQLNISPKQIEDFPFPQIAYLEQSKIAEILDTLDFAICETEAIISKLKAVKLGLLHDLLTRGIDANGELRPPQAEAPHLYRESPLGWIPKDWSLKKLGQILSEPTKNGLYKSSQFHGRGPLMVQMGGLFSGDAVTFDTATRVSVTPFEFNNFGLAEGDLLFARRSLVFEGAGQCVIVRNLPEPSTFESSIVRVRVRSNEAEPEFVCQYLRSYKSYIQRRTLIRQVAVSGVSSADIRELLVALPSPEEQRVHVARQLEVQTRIDLETMSVEKLRSQKSGLMDDLLTGRVRVTPLLNSNNEKGAS